MKIQILTDNPQSWILPYVFNLIEILKNMGHTILHIYKHKEVEKGDILFLLSCESYFNNLELNTHNIVVHESDLPEGKGWSPLTWQILEGKNEIPITLFEATDKIDSGLIYLKDIIKLNGNELVGELREKQGKATVQLILNFVLNKDVIVGKEQVGNSSFYRKRTPIDSELSINKTIQDQFNLFRVCDNEKYPLFFHYNKVKYILKIYKANE